MGRHAGAGGGLRHSPLARYPPPHGPRPPPGPHARGQTRSPGPLARGGNTADPPPPRAASTYPPPPPPAACRWRTAASFHAASPASRRARPPWASDLRRPPDLGDRARQAEERWLTCRHALFVPPLTPPFTHPDQRQLSSCVGRVLPPIPPPPRARATVAPLLPPPQWAADGTSPPRLAAALRGRGTPPGAIACGAFQRHVPVPALAHGRQWRVDAVLLSEIRLTAVAQQVMHGWQAFWGAPLESGGGGGGAWGMWGVPAAGGGISTPGHSHKTSRPQGGP